MPDTVYVIGSNQYGEQPCDTNGVGCGNGRSNGREVLYSDTAGIRICDQSTSHRPVVRRDDHHRVVLRAVLQQRMGTRRTGSIPDRRDHGQSGNPTQISRARMEI
jgi:hypothetical protein